MCVFPDRIRCAHEGTDTGAYDQVNGNRFFLEYSQDPNMGYSPGTTAPDFASAIMSPAARE